MPPRERGYQAPARFCTLVRGMLDRTHGIGLSHSMVRLNMLDQMPNIDALRADLQARDERDRNRSISPLQPAADAMLLDNSALDVAASVQQVLLWWQGKQPFASHENA